MPPKKSKKISLNEFLGDSSLGSWADEMDALPTAPAPRNDDDLGRPGDRYGRRDDFLSSRPDRAPPPPREDIPLPTQPPFTAFIGNLAFDLTELELEEFFAPSKAKSVKIIRDREDKPKGFGYIEFENLDGLKDAISKSGSNFSGRTVRVSVAEPPKERDRGLGPGSGAHEDDAKFDSPWRRDGPLPDRDSSRRRPFDGSPAERLPSVAEDASQWRSNRPSRSSLEPEPNSARRRGSGFSTHEGSPSAADIAETWARGAKFSPSEEKEKFGSFRGSGPPKEPTTDEGDWRRPRTQSSASPGSSTPPTPQMTRRKLELLPRSGSASVSPSPLSSPRLAPTISGSSGSRANPFGTAKPVDVSGREKEVLEKIDKDRDATKERLSMSRTNSRSGYERSPLNTAASSGRTPPPTATPPERNINGSHQLAAPKPSLAPNVRPTLTFANAAAAKKVEEGGGVEERKDVGANEIDKVAEEMTELTV